MANIKFLKGSQASFNSITKNADTFYYVDGKNLYLGDIKLSNTADVNAALDRITTNADEISSIKTALGDFTGNKFNTLSGEFATVKADVATLKTDVSTLQATTGNHTTKLEAVEAKAGANETAISGLQGSLADLSSIVATDENLQAEITRAKAEEARIAGLVATEQGRAEGVEANHESRIATMELFWDTTQESDKVVNTLKEIQEYIASDETGAAAMAESIAENKQAIADAKTAYEAADTTLQGNIDALAERVATVEGHTADLNPRMTAVEAKANVNEGAIATNAGNISKNAAAIETNAGNISANSDAIAAEAKRATLAEGGLDERIKSLEEMTTGGTGSIAQQISAAKSEAIKDANDYTDGQVSAATTHLEGEIEAAAAQALADAKADAAKTYATLEQGAKADSALQAADITTGTANGSIKVDGSDIAVAGLGSAAFTEASAYDVSGAAAAAQTAAASYTDSEVAKAKTHAETKATAAENNAKAYVDEALTWGTF